MIALTVMDNKNTAVTATPRVCAEVPGLLKNELVAVIGKSAIITIITAVDNAAANSDSICLFRRNCAVFASCETAPKPYRRSISSLLINIVRTSRFVHEPLWIAT